MKKTKKNQAIQSFIILSMVFQTQLVRAIGRQLFGSLESFPGLAIGMMGEVSFSRDVQLDSIGLHCDTNWSL